MKFIYGGCGATRNIFGSRKECEDECGVRSTLEDYGALKDYQMDKKYTTSTKTTSVMNTTMVLLNTTTTTKHSQKPTITTDEMNLNTGFNQFKNGIKQNKGHV